MKTKQDLINHINKVVGRDLKLSDQQLFWFVAVVEARRAMDAGTKDLARIILEGMKPVDDQYVTGWIGTMVDEDDIEGSVSLLEEYIIDHFTNQHNG